MIYNRSGQFYQLTYKATHSKSLSDWKPDVDVIYHYHPYHGGTIVNAFDDIHWEHLRSEPTAKFLYENCNETFTFELVEQIKNLIDLKQIPSSKIFMLVMDEVHKSFLEDRLKELNIRGITIGIYNIGLVKSKLLINDQLITKKFSGLSRRYVNWRLHLYARLAERNLLKDFIYSFYNIHPYGEVIHFDKDCMLKDLYETNFGSIGHDVLQWMDNIPYELEENILLNAWDDETYKTVFSADIHVLVETHYDFYYVPKGPDNIYYRKLAPSFMTEKGYKPIVCARPFIAFSTPYFLEQVRELGFETFSPYINEEYDLELDHNKRANMIVAEIERISNLPTDKYQQLVKDCNAIADRNRVLFVAKQSDTQYNPNFAFMSDHCEVLYIIH